MAGTSAAQDSEIIPPTAKNIHTPNPIHLFIVFLPLFATLGILLTRTLC
jgi:hypothetical protein